MQERALRSVETTESPCSSPPPKALVGFSESQQIALWLLPALPRAGALIKPVYLSAGNKNAASFATVIKQARLTQQNSQGNEEIVRRRLKEKTGSLTVQSHKNHPKLTIIKVPLIMRSPLLRPTRWMGTTTRRGACFKCSGGVFKS